MKVELAEPDGTVITVILNSWLARALKPGSINNGVTLSARTIRFARNYWTRRGIAHERGHTLQAERLGWKYLPWIAYNFVRYGYRGSKAELDADAYMTAHWTDYQDYGPVPPWAR